MSYVCLKKERKKASHDLLNAITFETASASLLLHLACGSMASSSTVTVPSGGGEFNVLLVDSWREAEQLVTPPPLPSSSRSESHGVGRIPPGQLFSHISIVNH